MAEASQTATAPPMDATALEICEEIEAHVPSASRTKLAEVRAALQAYDFDAAVAAIDAIIGGSGEAPPQRVSFGST